MSDPPPPPQWVLDLSTPAIAKPKSSGIPDPPGFNSSVSSKKGDKAAKQNSSKVQRSEDMDSLKLKKAWEVAIAPFKQLPMNAIGMWMTGNSLQVFSLFMVFTLFKNPINAILNINPMFQRFESENIRGQMVQVKFVYVLANLLALALGVYKINKMGLLPTTRSDWLAWEPQRVPLERAVPAFDL